MEFGDRLFWGIMILIGVILIWLGLLPASAPVWVGAVLGGFGGFGFIKFGPRPRDKERGE